MYQNLDALIARIALSLWTSDRKVERVPVMTIVQPWEVANIVPVPESLSWGSYLSPMLTIVHSDAIEGI